MRYGRMDEQPTSKPASDNLTWIETNTALSLKFDETLYSTSVVRSE